MKTIDLSREILTARGALAAPFFTWLAMVTFTVAFYMLTASAPMLGETTWMEAARLGTGWWMTAFGGETNIAGSAVSLMPLTVTFIAIYASYVSFRKREVATWSEVAAAGVTQAGVVGVIGLLMRPEGAWWPAVIGGFVIGATTAAFAARYHLLQWEWLYASWGRTRLLIRALTIAGVAVLVLAVIMGWSRMVQIHGYYLTGVVGGIGLVLVQLAYMPVAFVWALAWLLGPGFAVGEGTTFSVLGVESAPLPAIPMLGALPQVSDGLPWVLAIVAVVFFVLGVIVTRREDLPLAQSLKRSAIAAVLVALIVAVLGLLASGAIGPERMATTGAVPAELFGFTLLVVGLPFVLATTIAHGNTLAYLRGRADEVKAKREEKREAAAAEETQADENPTAVEEVQTDDVTDEPVSESPTPASPQSAPTPAHDTDN